MAQDAVVVCIHNRILHISSKRWNRIICCIIDGTGDYFVELEFEKNKSEG